jgi:4'-phosphopantetheinyl transferase
MSEESSALLRREVPDAPPAPGTVDLHLARLDVADAEIARLRALLTDDERARAARFVHARDARKFIVARATLRTVLGRYLGEAPEALALTQSEHGKPRLVTGELRFSVSHAGEVALYGVAARRELGVDIELVRRDLELEAIAERFFAPRERADVLARAGDARVRTFFACWTRKEAFVKALGLGLGYPLVDFEVGVDPDAVDVPLRVLAATPPQSAFRIVSVPAPEGYAAALAAESGPLVVRAFEV